MNKRPVSYLQTDARWKTKRYPCTGGTMSIGGGGCGETSVAMLISTLTGKSVLPTDTMEWACRRGYVVAEQGTTYSYFKPQFAAYGIECEMINKVCLNANSPVRQMVIDLLKQGYYFIALMKKGLWTNGGHYVVVWWADNKIRINDPASTRNERLNGDPDTFFSQAKYFWSVDARKYNNKEELDMTKAEFLKSLTPEEAAAIVTLANQHYATLKPSKWAEDVCRRAAKSSLFSDGDKDGFIDRPQSPLLRQEFATVLDRMGAIQ